MYSGYEPDEVSTIYRFAEKRDRILEENTLFFAKTMPCEGGSLPLQNLNLDT